MGLETFLSRQNDCLLCESLSSSIHSRWPRLHHVTITLWQQDILYCAIFNWCSPKCSCVKLTKLLVRCLNAPWKSFYINQTTFLWHSESSSTVTLLLHADWMMLKNSSNQGGENSATLAPWQMKSRPRLLVDSKALILENYLAVSTWILNGSSIESLEKKYQPFSLAGVRFGSLVNQISGLKSAWHRSGLCLICCYAIAVTSEFYETTCVIKQIYLDSMSL